jgi:hypothetical protein
VTNEFEALPTLAERRRLARESFQTQQDELARQIRIDPSSDAVRTTLERIELLRQLIDYFGEPNPRLDLYRVFCQPLPMASPARDPDALRPDLTEEERAKALRIGRLRYKSAGAVRRRDANEH